MPQTNTASNIDPQPLPQLATVSITQNGTATHILYAKKTIKIYAQGAHISPLTPGDEVLFFDSAKGPYIVSRTLKHHEHPAINFQQIDTNTLNLTFGETQLSTTATGNITIKNSQANININEKGEIQINSKTLKQVCREDIRLNAGKHIHLNGPDY